MLLKISRTRAITSEHSNLYQDHTRLNDTIFEQEEPLAVIQFDNDDEPANLYKKYEGHNYSK